MSSHNFVYNNINIYDAQNPEDMPLYLNLVFETPPAQSKSRGVGNKVVFT